MTKFIIFLLVSVNAFANDYSYMQSSEVRPESYLFRDNGLRKDPVFDRYRTIDLGFELGIGSDCGRINISSTLKSSLKNLLNTDYFGNVGQDILAGSPMLITCYFSPTWCSILKNTRISANFLSKMRLDQCSLMDKYVDSRTEVFYQERQKCAHAEIAKNGGNMEAAMKKCGNRNVMHMDLSNWAGNKFGEKTNKNELIGSSAKWAGFNDKESKSSLGLIKSLVGDNVVSKGNVSVSYGDKSVALTPRKYLKGLEKETYASLCDDVMGKIDSNGSRRSVDQVVTENDLKKVNGGLDRKYIDRQTLRYLAHMPFKDRAIYCKKLSHSVSMAAFSEEMNRSLDMMTVMLQNPNLPETEKLKLNRKRNILKDQISYTLELQRERNAPLNRVVAQINQEGRVYQGRATDAALGVDASRAKTVRSEQSLMDCSDEVFCEGDY